MTCPMLDRVPLRRFSAAMPCDRWSLFHLFATLVMGTFCSVPAMAESVKLERNKTLQGTLQPGSLDTLLIESRVDNYSNVYVNARGASVRLFDSEGVVRLSSAWPGRACGKDWFRWIHDKPGAWYIEIEARCADEPVTYTVQWQSKKRTNPHEMPMWQLSNEDKRVSQSLQSGDLQGAFKESEQILDLLDSYWPIAGTAYLEGLAQRFRPMSCTLSEGYLDRAIQRRQQENQRDRFCDVLDLESLLEIQGSRGRFTEARTTAQNYVDAIADVSGTRSKELARAQRVLGDILLEAGEYDAASNAHEAGLNFFNEKDASPDRVNLLKSLAEVRRSQNRYEDAEALLSRAWEIGQAPAFSWLSSAPVANSLAGVARDRGHFAEAEYWIDKANDLVPEGCGTSSVAMRMVAHLNRAEVLRLQGRYEESRPWYESSLELRKNSSCTDSPQVAWSLNQLGKLEQDVGDPLSAIVRYESARELLERANVPKHPLRGQNLLDLASARYENGEHTEALKRYQEARDVVRENFGAGHPEVAQPLVALARYRLQGATGNQTAGSEASALAFSEVEEALGLLQIDHLGTGLALAYPQVAVDALILRARIAKSRNESAVERETLEKALGIVDALRFHQGGEDVRARFVGLRLHLQAMEDLVDHYVIRGELAQALMTQEQFRGRLLLETLETRDASPLGSIPPDERRLLEEEVLTARIDIASLQKQLTSLQWPARDETIHSRDLNDIKTRLEIAVRTYERALGKIHNAEIQSGLRPGKIGSVSLSQLQQSVIPERAALLIYLIGLSRSYAFLVPRNGELMAETLELSESQALALGTKSGPLTVDTLELALSGLRLPQTGVTRGVKVPDAGWSMPALEALGGVVMPQRLWSVVRDLDEIVIIPDGRLHYIPFQALVVEGNFWLHSKPAIRYIPSAAFEYGRSQRPRRASVGTSTKPVLSLSNPVFDLREVNRRTNQNTNQSSPTFRSRVASRTAILEPFERLQGTAAERDALLKVFGSEQVEVLTDFEATESALRARLDDRLYLHLATHGRVGVGGTELLAALVLTPPAADQEEDSYDDGFLNAYEIVDLNLDCELAVLSACETSVGPLMPGEGVFALSRSFLTAGARRVVSTLWQVDDASTALLIGWFFDELVNRGGQTVNYAVALRNAQRRLAGEPLYSSPYYWAPFVLSGSR